MVFQMSQDEISKDLFSFGEKKYFRMKVLSKSKLFPFFYCLYFYLFLIWL